MLNILNVIFWFQERFSVQFGGITSNQEDGSYNPPHGGAAREGKKAWVVGKLRSFQESRGGDGKHLNYQQCQVFISNNNIINEFNIINMININTSIIHKIVMLLQKVHCNNLAISWLGNFKDWKISKFLLRSLLILVVYFA